MGRIGEGVPCGEDPGVPAAGPAAAEFNCGELGLRCPDLYSPADQAGIERVVVSIKTQIWLWGDPDHPTVIGARQMLWQLTHFGLLFLEVLADDPFGGAVFSIVCLRQPSIELVLEIKRVGEAPASLEVAVEEAVASLKNSFGLRVAGLKDDPAKVHLAEVCGKAVCRATSAFVEGALTVDHGLLWQGAKLGQTPVHAPTDVFEALGEDQGRSKHLRIRQLRGQQIALTGLAPADRDLFTQLHQIELGELPGTVVGALEGPRCAGRSSVVAGSVVGARPEAR